MAHLEIDLGLVTSMDVEQDEDCKLQLIEIFQKVANSEQEPQSAATEFMGIITDRCKADLVRFLDSSTPREVDETGDTIGPDPEMWQRFTYYCFVDAAKVVPADDSAQDRLIELLVQLQKLPQTPLKGVHWDGNSFYEKRLWVLNRANHNLPFEQMLAFCNPGEYSMEDKPENHVPYVNYSAFLARLMGSGAMNSAALSALIASSFWNHPMNKKMDLKEYEACVMAAAQWIYYAGAALYEICDAGALLDVSSHRWKKDDWTSFKDKFAKISIADRFSANVQKTAARAVDTMVSIEKQGVTSNFIELYGYLIPLPLEDTDEEDGEDENESNEGNDEDHDNDDSAKAHNEADDNTKRK